MLGLAWRLIKGRRGGFVGTFVALLAASALITGCGILLQSGLASGAPPERYTAAPIVVGAEQALPDPNVPARPYGERVRVSARLVDEVAAVPGVADAIGDTSFPIITATAGGDQTPAAPMIGHNWTSAQLGPFRLTAGREPATAGEVVIDSQLANELGVTVDDRLTLAVGAIPVKYVVAGIAAHADDDYLRQHAVFFTPDVATTLSGYPDQVDAVAVLPEPGIEIAELSSRIESALPAHGIRAFTGDERGEIEFLDIAQAKGTLVAISGSFGGVALMVALFIVASTLALQVQQRRRELALLRAIAATPHQLDRMIGLECVLVALVAALIGVPIGLLLSSVLRDAFAGIGLIPGDFALVIGPVPILVAVALCAIAARSAAWAAARRAVRISPVTAMDEAAAPTPKLGLVRTLIGLLLLTTGLGLALLPMIFSGDTATGAAAMSVIMLVISTALLGPRIATIAIALLGPILRAVSPVAGFLAAANTRGNARRLASAITPLVLAIAVASVQLFTGTTRAAVATDQATSGVTADFVVTGKSSGLSPHIAESIAALPETTAVTPVIRDQVLGEYIVAGSGKPSTRSFAVQGVTATGLSGTMDLDLRAGRMDQLTGNSVALSQIGAELFRAGPGDRITLYLSDGTPIRPTVVAIYGRGLGFGDITLPRGMLLAHSPNRMDDLILIDSEPGHMTQVAAALGAAVQRYLGVAVDDREGFTAAQQAQSQQQGAATMLLLIAVFGYIAIGVANTLVMSTMERRREFALLRLIGAKPRQVMQMLFIESIVVVAVATIIGTALAIPPLIGVSLGLSERSDPYPAVDLPVYLAIVGVTVLIGLTSIMLPARRDLGSRPTNTIGVGE